MMPVMAHTLDGVRKQQQPDLVALFWARIHAIQEWIDDADALLVIAAHTADTLVGIRREFHRCAGTEVVFVDDHRHHGDMDRIALIVAFFFQDAAESLDGVHYWFL